MRAAPTSARTTPSRSPVADLLRRAEAGDVVVLDVRPAPEYAAGRLPGAVSIPLEELEDRLAELPEDREVIALLPRCLLRPGPRRSPATHRPRPAGTTRHRRRAGMASGRSARPGRRRLNPANDFSATRPVRHGHQGKFCIRGLSPYSVSHQRCLLAA
ncbi:rhodanese-like domain-containing protein [Micromonospora sp. NBC_00898]|uniref:rhodanese-like domain-containing protein n=1 Tax=Micromonospora sp. NBC_00898 TaxID=2975981 RepID=UPI00386D773D|nr:rhodanese-like domain-containing protein [Micromonospora sp. NBC_00898]